MKPILVLLLLLPFLTPAQDVDSTKNEVKNYNNLMVTAGAGLQWSKVNGRRGRAYVVAKTGGSYSGQITYCFRKHPKSAYFSTGFLFNVLEARYSFNQPNFVDPNLIYIARFYGVPLSLNIPIRLSDKVKLINELSAVPLFVTYPIETSIIRPFDFGFQYRVLFKYKHLLVGVKLFRPLKTYTPKLSSVNSYVLTGLNLSVGYSIGRD